MEGYSKESGEDRAKVLRDSIELISKKWHPQIVYKLDEECMRFNSLESELGDISSKVLSSSLSDLCEKDLVDKCEKGYCLTSKGLEMKSALDSIVDWGQRFSDASDVDVLVVEDENLQKEMYERWLENYDVETTSNLEESYDLITSDTDLVLLDRVVEDGESDEIAESLKEKHPNLQIIMITAVDPDTGILELDIDYYLIKPVKKQELLEVVNRALEKSNKTEDKKELLSLASKKAVLDKKVALEDSQRYDELQERIETLRSKFEGSDDILSDFDI